MPRSAEALREAYGGPSHRRPGEGPDDLTEIARLAKEDPEVMEDLMRFLRPRLLKFALKRGASEADANDLVQETLLRVASKLHTYRAERGRFFTWAGTILTNLMSNHARNESVLERCKDDVKLEATSRQSTDFDRQQIQRIERRRTMAHLREAILDLPPEQREVLELSFFRGLKQAKIAELMGTPINTVKTRKYRAIEKLREHFAEPEDLLLT